MLISIPHLAAPPTMDPSGAAGSDLKGEECKKMAYKLVHQLVSSTSYVSNMIQPLDSVGLHSALHALLF